MNTEKSSQKVIDKIVNICEEICDNINKLKSNSYYDRSLHFYTSVVFHNAAYNLLTKIKKHNDINLSNEFQNKLKDQNSLISKLIAMIKNSMDNNNFNLNNSIQEVTLYLYN